MIISVSIGYIYIGLLLLLRRRCSRIYRRWLNIMNVRVRCHRLCCCSRLIVVVTDGMTLYRIRRIDCNLIDDGIIVGILY